MAIQAIGYRRPVTVLSKLPNTNELEAYLDALLLAGGPSVHHEYIAKTHREVFVVKLPDGVEVRNRVALCLQRRYMNADWLMCLYMTNSNEVMFYRDL